MKQRVIIPRGSSPVALETQIEESQEGNSIEHDDQSKTKQKMMPCVVVKNKTILETLKVVESVRTSARGIQLASTQDKLGK